MVHGTQTRLFLFKLFLRFPFYFFSIHQFSLWYDLWVGTYVLFDFQFFHKSIHKVIHVIDDICDLFQCWEPLLCYISRDINRFIDHCWRFTTIWLNRFGSLETSHKIPKDTSSDTNMICKVIDSPLDSLTQQIY